jgi:hypothetical protein
VPRIHDVAEVQVAGGCGREARDEETVHFAVFIRESPAPDPRAPRGAKG